MNISIPGLPEGLTILRIGQAEDTDEWMYSPVSTEIVRGPNGFTGLIVSINSGFSAHYDMASNRTFLVRNIAGGRKIRVEFEFSNEVDCASTMAICAGLPGFVSATEVPKEI